ncbi:MAG: DNA-processing protein DprA [Nitrospiria bacterium]
MNDERYDWIGLKNISGVGNVLFKRLLDEIGPPPSVFSSSWKSLTGVEGMTERAVDEILHFKGKQSQIIDELEKMDAHQVSFVHYFHPGYPSPLKNIYDPPPFLYMTGEIWKQDTRSIAIVGTRKPTLYGKQVARELASDLAREQLTVVSGFASGIDQIAHQAALSSGGRTLAVLGCGIDVNYPFGSLPLKEAISAQGAVMTEFPMGMQASPSNFPRRNRLISGLSLGVVVVEATEKSGSLITASTALEQGKEVFAVPGPIYSDLSRGTHLLIKSGAKLVENISDILQEVKCHLQTGLLDPARENSGMAGSGDHPDLSGLSPDQRKIYDILSMEPVHLDDLAFQAGFPSHRCAGLLLHLELKGLVNQTDGNQFMRTLMNKVKHG